MKSMRTPKRKSNIEVVKAYMSSNSMHQVFVLEALHRYAKQVCDNREELRNVMADSMVEPEAWISCADEWMKNQNI